MLLETFLPGRNVALWLQKFSPFSGERGEEVKDLDYQAAGGPVKPSGPRRYLLPYLRGRESAPAASGNLPLGLKQPRKEKIKRGFVVEFCLVSF